MENSKVFLDEYLKEFEKRKQIVEQKMSKNPKAPAGWFARERFGINMRYWPMTSEIFDIEESAKKARGVPLKYLKFFIDELDPWDWWQAKVINYMNVMYTKISNPLQSLVVFGGNGCGKTLLGSAFINTVARYDSCIDAKTGDTGRWNPLLVNEADLFNRIEGYVRDGMDWFREYTENCQLLVIDEFGMTQWTPTDKRRIEQVLNKRFGNGLKTVILTNLKVEEFASLLSDQLKSRFKTGRSFEMESPDYREKYADEDDAPDYEGYTGSDDPF